MNSWNLKTFGFGLISGEAVCFRDDGFFFGDGFFLTSGRFLSIDSIFFPLFIRNISSDFFFDHFLQQWCIGTMHYCHRFSAGHEKPSWFALTSKHFQLRYGVRLGHCIVQKIVVDFQFYFLEEIGHGTAGSAPFRVHVHNHKSLIFNIK